MRFKLKVAREGRFKLKVALEGGLQLKGQSAQSLGGLQEEVLVPGITVARIPPGMVKVDEYSIHEPFARIVIGREMDSEHTGLRYFVDEVRLTEDEHKAYRTIIDILSRELSPPDIGKEEDTRKAIVGGARRLLQKYKKAFKNMTDDAWDKVLYYLERDMLGYGQINAIMYDATVEDVSCDGVGSPIFVWHREFESIPTNIIFQKKDVLDDYIIKLAHKSGKHVSSAFPIVDAMLYGRHRLAASFRDEVSPKGSTFTIRKFREEPLSIIDLIKLGTLTEEMAAYFWILLEHRATIMVLGGTGSGKTTALNALGSLIKPGMKIVTVEETAELNLPHENWVQLVSRESFGLSGSKAGQISLFDLVRMSLRYRPDYLVVGEVRGEEAFVLFQALATGHGGLSTMHADNLDYAIKRLTSAPMNISETYVSLMNVAVMIERVPLNRETSSGPTFGRRMRNVWEVADKGKYLNIAEWEPSTDAYAIHSDESYVIGRLAAKSGKKRSQLLGEMARRSEVLGWMVRSGISTVRDVSKVIAEYYASPESVLSKIDMPSGPMVPMTSKPTPASREVEMRGSEIVTALTRDDSTLRDPFAIVMEVVTMHGGAAEIETALKMSKLDAVSFWNGVDHLKRTGRLVSGERIENGTLRTYLVSTDLGRIYRAQS